MRDSIISISFSFLFFFACSISILSETVNKMLRKHVSVELPNSGIQIWPPGSVPDEERRPRQQANIDDRKQQSKLFANLEFCLFIFGVCSVWCAFVLIMLKTQKFPIQKHFVEVVAMVVLPVMLSFLSLYGIDQWVNYSNRV